MTKEQQFKSIEQYASEFSVSLLLRLTTVSRAGYYKWKKSKPKSTQTRDKVLYQLILQVFEASKKTYGVQRIKAALLNKLSLIINHKCIRRIMHKYHLVCVLPKSKFNRRLQPFGTIKNVLNREFSSEKLLQKLCLDITYLKVTEPYPKWVYLCAVKDLYNQEIIAYDISSSQNMRQIFKVLHQLSKLPLENHAILHTDQGFQFTNKYYMKRLVDMGLTQYFKAEMPHFSQPKTVEEVLVATTKYINYYNHQCIQTKYGMSPIEFRLHAA